MKTIEPIRIEKESEAKLIAGINKHYLNGAAEEIPRQWEQFNAKNSQIPNRTGSVAYGVCFSSPEKGGIRYLCGIEVTVFGELPEPFSYKTLPSHSYAVFSHDEHVSGIRQTIDAIWNSWYPEAGLEVAEEAGFFFERYGESFDPQKGTGDIEIWVPIKL